MSKRRRFSRELKAKIALAACRRTQRRSAAGPPAGHRAGGRTREHRVPLRLRRDGSHRRRPHRAARYRPGTTPSDRHGAAEVCLPDLRAGRHPSAVARLPDRGSAADRGAAGECAGVEVRRPPSAVSSISDLRPLGQPRPRRGFQTRLTPYGGAGRAYFTLHRQESESYRRPGNSVMPA